MQIPQWVQLNIKIIRRLAYKIYDEQGWKENEL